MIENIYKTKYLEIISIEYRKKLGKIFFDIRIYKKFTKLELSGISRILFEKLSNLKYTRAFLTYYLPGMQIGAGPWATAHFNPGLRPIEILDFMLEFNPPNFN